MCQRVLKKLMYECHQNKFTDKHDHGNFIRSYAQHQSQGESDLLTKCVLGDDNREY